LPALRIARSSRSRPDRIRGLSVVRAVPVPGHVEQPRRVGTHIGNRAFLALGWKRSARR